MAEELFDFSIMTKTDQHMMQPNAKYRYTKKQIENIKELRTTEKISTAEFAQLKMLKKIKNLEIFGGFEDPKCLEMLKEAQWPQLRSLSLFPWPALASPKLFSGFQSLNFISISIESDLTLELENLESLFLDFPQKAIDLDLSRCPKLSHLNLAVGSAAHKIILPPNLAILEFQSFSHNMGASSTLDPSLQGVTFDAANMDFSLCSGSVATRTNRVVLKNLAKPINSQLDLAGTRQSDFAEIPQDTANLSLVMFDDVSFLDWPEWSRLANLKKLKVACHASIDSAKMKSWLSRLSPGIQSLELSLQDLNGFDIEMASGLSRCEELRLLSSQSVQKETVEAWAKQWEPKKFYYETSAGTFLVQCYETGIGWGEYSTR